MSRSRRSSSGSPSRFWKRLAIWGIPSFLLLLVVGFIVGKAMIESYLRGDSFRRFVADKAGVTLKSQCELAPLQFTGLSVYTDSFKAQGNAAAPFANLSVEQFRADMSLRRFFDHVWQVEQVDVQRVQVSFDGPRSDTPSSDLNASAAAATSEKPGWLPNRVEIGSATVHDANMSWKGGSVQKVALKLTPADAGGWNITGQSGKIEQAGLPPLDIQNLRILARDRSIFFKEAEFRQGGEGTVKISGEAVIDDHLDLQTTLDNIPLAPFLAEDWRVRLKGNVSGEVKVKTRLPFPADGAPTSGSLHITHGELTALPVLDQIALFTTMQQFRHLTLSKAEGDFQQDGKKLQVSKFVMESEGLIRIEGAFTIENSMIDGTFQVGVTPSSLQWLPGSRAKVFVDTRGGYVWSPMRLTGPMNKPNEDLTPRLVAAMQGAVIEGAQNAVQEGLKTGSDALKGALDFFTTPKK